MRHILPYLGLFEDTAFTFMAGKDITILEIGVARGSSTRAFLDGANRRDRHGWGKVKLYSIDIEDVHGNLRGIPNINEWNFVHCDSHSYEWENGDIDVFFIDGDHSYEGAKVDFNRYLPFVKSGGIIYMHDVIHPRYGVKDFWKEIECKNKFVLPFNASGLGIIVKE